MLTQCYLFFVLLIVTLTFANGDDQSVYQYRGYILKTNGKYETVIRSTDSYTEPDTHVENILATGFWAPIYNTTGWSVLEIKTSENQTNIDQAYSAGLLEGQLTQELTSMQWQNSIVGLCTNKDFCKKLKQFFQIQLNWTYAQIDANPNDEYWHQVDLLLIQLNGLIDGYENKTRGPRKEVDDPLGFLLFQTITSVGDIAAHLGFTDFPRQDHCSALIKLLPNNKDVLISHATWDSYRNMLRILKRYTMPLKRTSTASTIIPGYDVIFSTYPGTLQSNDDFYMIRSTNLTVIETTIEIYNHDLYRNVQPETVSEWMRVIVANRLGDSGKQWVNKFFMYNDGTYNNEWMIADFKQFTPGQSPKPGFLIVAEQLITYYESADMTEILKNNSYWASYNNVYFPNFRNISGEEDVVKEKGPNLYSWYNSSRAKIFRRDHHKVVDLSTMINMIRYNDFQHDELSKCNCTPPYSATLTIASRRDLNDINGTYPDAPLRFGCRGASDAKITSYKLMQDFSLVAIAGPTTDQQKPFVWSESYCDKQFSHIGQPDKWDFKPYTPTWKLS